MKIELEKYVIATIDEPIMFDDGNGYNTDYIDEAYSYDDKEDAERILKTFDIPNDYHILKVKIMFEL